jgi:hypothetical protein
MAANETVLGSLHDVVASVLITAMQGRVIPGYTDEATGEVIPDTVFPPSAAEIQAATKFLKDNNITCAPSADNSVGELEEIMRNRKARLRTVGGRDLEDATEQTSFMNGLPK